MNTPAACPHERLRNALRWFLVLLYAVAGVAHLRTPHGFELIVPDWVPHPHQVVLATGVAELLGAAGLLVPRLRWWAGLGLAAYAVAVYPANIKHALDHVVISGVALGWSYHAPRLLLQPVLVWAALFAGRVLHWPWAKP